MGKEEKAPDEAAGATESADATGYSSVVYFHGMGSQRRYEETSRLVDRIDTHLGRQHRQGNSIGLLNRIRVRVEPMRPETGPADIVGYIRTRFLTAPDALGDETRFYEAYWAPVMAEAGSPWRVVQWLFTQPLRPLVTLRTPWRERQRLRRASLVSLFERGRTPPRGSGDKDYAHLLKTYDRFEDLDAQRRYPEGTFEQFLLFIDDEFAGRPDTIKRLRSLAKIWLSAYRREELGNAFILLTMAVTLLLLAGGVVAGVMFFMQSLADASWVTDLLSKAGVGFIPDWKTAAAGAASLVGLFGIGRFLTDYMGDVQAWATYEETDAKHTARNKTLDQCMSLMTHVLCDPRCERVTVVAHSLGTSVAHDTLLALTRRNRASRPDDPIDGPLPLRKIEHFVTMGSPIDKIEYLFESYASRSHRYKRVVEALRGDIGTPPFSRNNKPWVHWINFWDQGDIISGPLQSPASAAPYRQHVDNVHIASYLFPDLAASHSGYFDNQTVVQGLFDVIFRRGASFRTLTQPAPGQPYDYESVYLGPGQSMGTRSVFLATMLATPWLFVAGLAAWLLKASGPAMIAGMAGGFSIIGLFTSWMISHLKGQLKPL